MSLMESKILTFGGVPQPKLEACRAAIIPAPLEVTVTYGEGAALGPLAIMSASANMELYDEVLDSSPIDQGIYTHGRCEHLRPGGPVPGAHPGGGGRRVGGRAPAGSLGR